MLKLHINEYGQGVFISLFNVSVFSSSRDTWHRVVDMEDQGGIVHYLNYKFVVFVSIYLFSFFFSFQLMTRSNPTKMVTWLTRVFRRWGQPKKKCIKIKTGLLEVDSSEIHDDNVSFSFLFSCLRRDIKPHIKWNTDGWNFPLNKNTKKREEYCHQNKEMAHKGKLNEVWCELNKKKFGILVYIRKNIQECKPKKNINN